MARNARAERDVRLLISSVTGLKKGDENFNICLQFAQTNLKHHRYLDVDSHKVLRTIKGVYEKLIIHSEHEKERQLRQCVEKFLKRPDFDHDDSGRGDIHYSVLSLLLNLACSPTSGKYLPAQANATMQDDASVDWKTYLKEGLEPLQTVFPPTPEMSDLSDSDEESPLTKCVDISNPILWRASKRSDDDTVHLLVQQNDQERVDDRLMHEYWKGCVDGNLLTTTSFARDWERFLLSISPFCVQPTTLSYLTEYQVVRETIWLFSGSGGFIYELDSSLGRFSVRPHLALMHQTENPLKSMLEDYAVAASGLIELTKFCESITSGKHTIKARTYQAYAFSLMKWHNEFMSELSAIQKALHCREALGTLISMNRQLRPWLSELGILMAIHNRGIVDNGILCVPASSAVLRLFDSLSEALIALDVTSCGHRLSALSTHAENAGSSRRSEAELVLQMTLLTMKPYLDIIDSWLSRGYLAADVYREFIIQRNEDLKCEDELFWNDGWKACNDGENSSGTTPFFLRPVTSQLLLAAKSLDLLSCLKQQSAAVLETSRVEATDLTADDQPRHVEQTLFAALLAAVQSQLVRNGAAVTVAAACINTKRSSVERVEHGNALSTVDVRATQHLSGHIDYSLDQALLRDNMEDVLRPPLTSQVLNANTNDLLSRVELVCRSSSGYAEPLQLLISRTLQPLVESLCSAASRQLLSVLVGHHGIVKSLGAVRKYFFMEDGWALCGFLSALFEELKTAEPKLDLLWLNELFSMSLEQSLFKATSFCHILKNFSIARAEAEASYTVAAPVMPIVCTLDDLRLLFKVEWPLSLLLDEQSLKLYGSVFSFLLRVKQAKYLLDHLRFADLELSDTVTGIALPRMQVLMMRVRLMHYVNGIHDYAVTQVVYATGLEFERSIAACSDFGSLLSLHTKYVRLVHDRCLLNDSAVALRQAVLAILDAAVSFHRLWDRGTSDVTEVATVKNRSGELTGIEETCKKAAEFLSVFLHTVVKRRSLVHLESLAYVFSSSHQPS